MTKVDELVERVRLTPEERELSYKKSYQNALQWSDEHEVALSAKNFNPNRPADRERYFCSAHQDWIARDLAEAQLNKILSHPDLALIDREHKVISTIAQPKVIPLAEALEQT